MPARFRNVSQVEVGKTQPELEFMVVGVAVDFTREQVSRGAEVPQAHRGEPAVEEMERRIGIDLREAPVQSVRFRRAPELVERQREVGDRLGVPRLAL